MLFLAAEGGDKTEQPTPHRLREARRKGQVFKSTELNAAINILGVMLVLLLLGRMAGVAFLGMFRHYFDQIGERAVDMGNIKAVGAEAGYFYFNLVAPIFLTALLLGVASNLAQVGFLITPSQLTPQPGRLNPMEGLKRIVSGRALFELLKSLLKIVIVGLVAYTYVRGRLDRTLMLLDRSPVVCMEFFWQTMVELGLRVGFVYAALAVLDYLFQRWEYMKSMRMSRMEVKDELKHLEGDPLIRSRIREKQRHLARQRMLHDVPEADVVVTNPTEIAVALRYRADRDSAPRVVAKGMARIAAQIKKIARENEVPVVENPGVARLLWKQAEPGEEIPVDLYQAVAEILALVYRLKGKQVPESV